ncbi:hypothetical protein VAR608DRAFT_0963 [Variovorax sp. HW608]|nr:hypothetical protein VAR608DRAFT_0963 [Variovorax sp. HW608]
MSITPAVDSPLQFAARFDSLLYAEPGCVRTALATVASRSSAPASAALVMSSPVAG